MGNGGEDRNESRLAKGRGSRTIAMNTGGSEGNLYLRELWDTGYMTLFTEPSEGTQLKVFCSCAKCMVNY